MFKFVDQSIPADDHYVSQGYITKLMWQRVMELFRKEVCKEPLWKKKIVIARKNLSNPFMMWPLPTLVGIVSSWEKKRKGAQVMDAALTARILVSGTKI